MNRISQAQMLRTRAATVILIATFSLVGCNSSSSSVDSTQQDTSAANTTVVAASTIDSASTATPATNSTVLAASTNTQYSLVSSSGQVTDSSTIQQNSSLSFGSTGSTTNTESNGADMTPPSEAELAAMKISTMPTARIIQESILGFDTRYQINPPNTYPERAVALITYNNNSHCTGWLVSKDTLVTAGHCVHGGGSNGLWGTLSAFKIYPGFSDGNAPYGFCTPKELYSSSGWISSADSDSDIGIIKLDCEVGNSTGYLSYFVANPVDNTAITINGYPGDKASGTQQWGSQGTVSNSTASKLYYDNDTIGGMSGSPVWVKNGETAWAIGIHTNGESILSPSTNSGTRISQNVFDLITAVKALP